MKIDAMALDVDGEADYGEAQEEVAAPKESDVSSRADEAMGVESAEKKK